MRKRTNCLPQGSAEKSPSLTLLRARQAFSEMENWLITGEALNLPEHEVEAEMEKRNREVGRLMLQAHLKQRGTGAVGKAIEVRNVLEEQHVQKVRGASDVRTLTSIFGKVRVSRASYAAAGYASIHPLDETLQLPARSFSRELQRRVAEESIRGSYEEAAESIVKTTGNRLSKRSVEQIVEDTSQDFDAFYDQRKAPSGKSTGPVLVASMDGKGIPLVKPVEGERRVRLKKGEKINKKKMATVGTVYSQQRRIRTPEEVVDSLFREKRSEKRTPRDRPDRKRVWASLEKEKEEVIREVAEEMLVRDPRRRKMWSVVVDGERALIKLAKRHLPGATLVLDLIHALERIWTAGHALNPEGSPESVAWVKKHALMLLQGKVSQVVKGMKQSATKRGLKGAKLKAIKDSASYLYRNKACMRYDQYLAQGLPIASGAVEGACKHLVKDRMERSGMRWTVKGAEAMLRIRSIKLSGDWEAYWQFHIQRDRERLYGITWKPLKKKVA